MWPSSRAAVYRVVKRKASGGRPIRGYSSSSSFSSAFLPHKLGVVRVRDNLGGLVGISGGKDKGHKVDDRYHRWYSSYEYPTRNETPEVTVTLASDAGSSSSSPSSSSQKKFVPPEAYKDVDRFDDAGELTESERAELRSLKRKELVAAVPPVDPSGAIGASVPERFLTGYSASSSKGNRCPPESAPRTIVTTLPGGLRVATQETFGQVSTIGLLSDFGSRFETDADSLGATHAWELLGFRCATRDFDDPADIVATMDRLGGATYCSAGREQTMHCVDVLRSSPQSVEDAVHVLAQAVLYPRVTEERVEEAVRRTLAFQYDEWYHNSTIGGEVSLGEAVQAAAYNGSTQQLGRPHFCPPPDIAGLTADSIESFRRKHLRPDRTVLAGAGIEHERLVELAQRHVVPYFDEMDHLPQGESDNALIPSIYTGGEQRIIVPSNPLTGDLTRVALGLEVPDGWNSEEHLVPACVLQTLLGGGNSFSAGGPGKGMYSRLYREILNRFYWAESAEAFTSFHAESGLLGISGSTLHPSKLRDLTRVLADQLSKVGRCTDEELDRAKNMLRCNVLTQLESRLVLFEDIGRQLLTYGKREDVPTVCARIEAVTADDLQRLADQMMSSYSSSPSTPTLKRPTLAVVGSSSANVYEQVPQYDEVLQWFQ